MFTVFVDESGHSGENYNDVSQPFYVCAGWLVECNKLDEFRSEIINWELQFKSPRELKSSKVLRRVDGLSKKLELFSALAKFASPTYCVIEKRFAICAKIIESALDHTYNEEWRSIRSRDPEAKYNFAHELYDLLDLSELHSFAIAVRARNPAQVEVAYKKVLERVKASQFLELHTLLNAAPVSEVVAYLSSGTNLTNAINGTALFVLMSNLEGFFRRIGVSSWHLCHDEVVKLRPHFLQMHGWLKDGASDWFNREFGGSLPTGPYRIADLTFVDSSSEAGVRAADYLSGTLRHILENRNTLFEQRDDVVKKLSLMTFGPLVRKGFPDLSFPPLFHEVLSSEVILEVLRLFAGEPES